MIDLEKKISLRELLELCKQYDEHGRNDFPESEYEGREVFYHVATNLFNEWADETDLFKDYK